MNTIKIKIVDSRIRKEEIGYKSDGAAAIDIYALPTKNGYFDGYKTGIAVEIPEGYVGIIVPRSSTGIKGYTIKNTIGVIDSDYYNNSINEGHMWIKIKNEGAFPFEIKKHDRICQGIIINYLTVDNEEKIEKERISGIGSTTEVKKWKKSFI